MTKSRGIGRGKHGNHARGPRSGRKFKDDGQPTFGYSPHYYLKKYKTTQRPRKCERCSQNAYYNHEYFGYLCAPHLLDLVNIGETEFKWTDYPEIWQRTEQLLRRPAPSTGADATKERE